MKNEEKKKKRLLVVASTFPRWKDDTIPPFVYLRSGKHKLYNFVASKLAKNINLNDTNFEIKIDKSKGNLFLQEDFNEYFDRSLNIEIHAIYKTLDEK